MSGINLSFDQLPSHWAVLAPEDQREYLALRAQFHEAISKSRRGERIDVFVQRLKSIRAFITKDADSQWRRSLVCGIIFLSNSLAINIQQLRNLLGKCKSSINGSLQQLSYISKPPSNEIEEELTQAIPVMKDDHAELKKWTIRYGPFPDGAQNVPVIQDPEPVIPLPPAEPATVVAKSKFPCPLKCQHKFYDIIYISTSIQTEI
jgi:hypothetical protein